MKFSPKPLTTAEVKASIAQERKIAIDVKNKLNSKNAFSDLNIGSIKINSDFTITADRPITSKDDMKKILERITKEAGGLNKSADLAKLWIQNTIVRQDPIYNNEGKQIKGPIPHIAEIDGVKFEIANNSSNTAEMMATTNGKIWQNTTLSLKKIGATSITINETNYGGNGSHGHGCAFDIDGITVNGKPISATSIEGTVPYPKEMKAFDNAFSSLPGTYKVWTPWTMYSGSGLQYPNRTIEWANSSNPALAAETTRLMKLCAAERRSMTEAEGKAFIQFASDLGIKIEPREGKFSIADEFNHRHHNHYDVNLAYETSDATTWSEK